MTSLTELLQQGPAHAWLFIPTAILLGSLHGLEPGHSKTMMAAFIIAIRGTVAQAVLLGLSAAISHTAIVWIVALGGQYLGRGLNGEEIEPYLQIASAIIVACVAIWMLRRTWLERQLEKSSHTHSHDHDETREIDTGHGIMRLSIFEDGVPPVWRIHFDKSFRASGKEFTVTTERADGTRQVFQFADRGGYLESLETITEPHEFAARVTMGHGGHAHDYDVTFVEGHGHDHLHEQTEGLSVVEGKDYMDAHELAHANDISRRFRDRSVSTGQIVLFGLTSGLIPCPAAITVLLICLQLKEITLGVVLVSFFSIGLAVTMVMAGVVASLSVKQVQKRWSGFSTLARRAPYASGALMLVVAAYMASVGISGLVQA